MEKDVVHSLKQKRGEKEERGSEVERKSENMIPTITSKAEEIVNACLLCRSNHEIILL